MFQLLNERHRNEVLWVETNFAIHPHLFAEMHRDKKRYRRAFNLKDFTLTGMVANATAEARKPPPEEEQVTLRDRINSAMSRFGGKRVTDTR